MNKIINEQNMQMQLVLLLFFYAMKSKMKECISCTLHKKKRHLLTHTHFTQKMIKSYMCVCVCERAHVSNM